LPKDLKDKVSSKEAMSSLAEIESRYRVDLAMIVMKVMIKSLSIKDLPSIFVGEFGLTPEQADKMTQELKEKIFILVSDYVGLSSERRSLDLSQDINVLVKEAGLMLPSEFLVERLNKILAIYLRGVRSRIDTRASLAKNIEMGGLNLSSLEIDRVLKVCESQKFKYHDSPAAAVVSTPPASRLDKIVSTSDGVASSAAKDNSLSKPIVEYDLKRALASGETKRIVAPISENKVEEQNIVPPIVAPIIPAPVSAPASVPPVVAKEDPLNADSILNPISQIDPQKPIVHKPENNNFLNKLFFDNKNSAASSKVLVAASTLIAPIAPVIPIVEAVSVAKVVTPAPGLARKSILGNTAPSSGRPIMHDIKPTPKIMGPLEEIQFLDLTNFRRLGKTPEEITAKIFNKIKLLEKDGYEKMIAGISAWRKSPVSRLYLHIVQEAVISNLPLKEAIIAREQKKQEGLTLVEIEAIMNLNSKLIF
jgi:hypothetical protein